jgi:hypothetical protein
VPSIFPNLPSYLSKNISGVSRKDPAEKKKLNEERINKLQENFEKNDHVQHFVDMTTQFNNKIALSDNCQINLIPGKMIYFYTYLTTY